jgi:ubiquinone/menaquinone biosynthesis C-methylase UbiE
MGEVEEIKARAKVVWAAGDYDAVAEKILSVGTELVERAGIGAGDEVLDVACGTGNAAIPAAATGAKVTGLDLTPELFEAARARAEAAGVEVEWVEGDAEELPYDDESFDAVLSTFGCMFAPRQDVTAREMLRVLRSGGRLGICSWSPEGSIGDFFQTITSHMPPTPGPTPLEWGYEPSVKTLIGDSLDEFETARKTVNLLFDSVDAAIDFYTEKFGPLIMAKAALEAEGRWPALREDLERLYERHNAATDGTVIYPADYLMVLGRKR